MRTEAQKIRRKELYVREKEHLNKMSRLWRIKNKNKVSKYKKKWVLKWRIENPEKYKDAYNKCRFGGNKGNVLLRDDFKCIKCGITNEDHKKLCNLELFIHHVDKNKKNNNMDNLITMCSKCHAMTHHIKQKYCKRGHEFNEENIYIRPGTGGRQCLACMKLRNSWRYLP